MLPKKGGPVDNLVLGKKKVKWWFAWNTSAMLEGLKTLL